MSIEDRRQRERNRRREQILQAARDLILEQGYDETSMQEIADRAELSKGSLYIYFNNKNALFLAIIQFVLEQLQQKFRDVMRQDDNGFQLVEQLGEALIEFIQNHPEYFKALILYEAKVKNEPLNEDADRKEYKQIMRELLMTWTRAVQIGMQDGSITANANPKVLAIQLGYGIRGILQLCHKTPQNKVAFNLIKDSGETLDTIISQFIRVLLNGIRKTQKT